MGMGIIKSHSFISSPPTLSNWAAKNLARWVWSACLNAKTIFREKSSYINAARARENGGMVRAHGPQINPSRSISLLPENSKGWPQTEQVGAEIKVTFSQHSGHSPPGGLTMVLHPGHVGGNITSSNLFATDTAKKVGAWVMWFFSITNTLSR